MFGRKRRKARREREAEEAAEAQRAGGAHLRTPDDDRSAPGEAVIAPPPLHRAEPETPPEVTPSAHTEPDAGAVTEKSSPAPLRSLLTDGERLGFEPELAIPEDDADH